jgi:hypothetical protein
VQRIRQAHDAPAPQGLADAEEALDKRSRFTRS